MGALARLAITGLVALVEWACGGPPNGQSDGGQIDAADGGTDIDGGQDVSDGGTDLPKREGIEERWAEFVACNPVDLRFADQKLYALCEGEYPRIISCSIDQGLEKASCEDFVPLPKPVIGNTVFHPKPLVHSDLGNGFSVVSFTTTPRNHDGFYVIDRAKRQVTNQTLIKSPITIQTGLEPFEVNFNLPAGAILFGGYLLLATQNKNLETGDYFAGTILQFKWLGDGTLPEWDPISSYDTTFLTATDRSPTLFMQAGNEVWFLNNGSASQNLPSSFDVIVLGQDGKPKIERTFNHPIGNFEINPLKTMDLAMEPDPFKRGLLLASGHNLVAAVYDPNGDDFVFPWDAPGVIVSAQWFSQEVAFVADSESQVHSVTLVPNQPLKVNKSLPVFGEPTSAVLDSSACILYQGLALERERGAITAISCQAFTE